MCVGLGGGDDGGGGCGIVVGSTDPENMRLLPLLPTDDCWGLWLILLYYFDAQQQFFGGLDPTPLSLSTIFFYSMGRHGESSPGKRRRGNEDHRGHHHGRGEYRGNGRGIGSISGDRRAHGRGGLDNQHRRALDVMACSADDASSITNTNTYPGSSTATEAKSSKSSAITLPSTITILPWHNPQSHYIPIEEEERLLPVLLHWGRSERGMMKDQPPFRLQKLQKMLEMQRNNTPSNINNKNIRHSNSQNANNKQSSSTDTTSCYCRMTLLQSLSLRRHHLKLQNPKLSMPALRLGSDDDIKEAARLFECCVDVYLRTHNIPFITEDEQKTRFTQSITPDMKRSGIVKQPPTPDFMIMVGHSVILSYNNNNIMSSGTTSCSDDQTVTCPISIHWIEVKMFYGASTIPSGTSNAVGCILPKVKQYVSLYGTGAIVFMYGCGVTLAEELLTVGVVALDGRCLDLDNVERHQKRWCADSWGNILF